MFQDMLGVTHVPVMYCITPRVNIVHYTMLQTSISLDYGLAEHVFKNHKEDNIYSVFISYT